MAEQDMEEDPIVKIVVENRTICCKKSVLVKGSDYFQAMFQSRMCESQSNIVTLQGQMYTIISRLVHCMETEELQINDDVTELLQAAVMFQIPSAQSSCIAYLLRMMDDSSCLSVMKLACSLCIHSLYSQARRHALHFFNIVRKHREFLHLSTDHVYDYLSDRHLNCLREDNVLDAIWTWYMFDPDTRRYSLPRLLQCIDTVSLLAEPKDKYRNHPLLTKTEPGKDWLQKQLSADNVPCDGQRRCLPVMFLSVGGNTLLDEAVNMCTDIGRFSVEEKQFVPYQSLRDVYRRYNPKMGFSATVVGKDLYLSGGLPVLTRANFQMNVWRFDSFTEHWEVATQLRTGRRHQGSCGSETCLYLLGGFNKFRDILDTFECYDTQNDIWMDLPPMPEKQICPRVCYHDNSVYLAGRLHLYQIDLNCRQWTQLVSESFMQPVILNNCVYNFKRFDELEVVTWFSGEGEGLMATSFTKYNLDTLHGQTVTASEDLIFGNDVVVSNGKLYMLQCKRSGDLVTFADEGNETSSVEVIGRRGVAGVACSLVVLPRYPEYKVPIQK